MRRIEIDSYINIKNAGRTIPVRGNELRKKYLDFFAEKGHLIVPSASLVPENDPSLLLIGAGMAPFKAFFTGKMMPPRTRIVDSQKCIRTGDIENVGRTARHHTFFEMLGNFSFGDYFKKDAINWAWEFLTDPKWLGLPADKLWVTIYPDDEEAFDIWHKEVGLPEERIIRLEDNFWEIGSGPCGPCSEIFIDLGEERGCGTEECTAGCDCDRYLEIWNLVFTQFDNDGEGNYTPLEKKNIDTGAGLERLASVLQRKASNFETDLLFPIIEKTCEIGKVKYGANEKEDISLKVLADHSRAMVFLIGDGVLPSNEGRGYVLRRLIRRALRHARLLGIEKPLLEDLARVVFEIMEEQYPELKEKSDFILKVLEMEEKRFQETLTAGTELLTQEMERLQKEGKKALEGSSAFKLYDTYGFPWELTLEILSEQGLGLDEDGFRLAMKEQQERARAARQEAEATFDIPDLRGNLKVDVSYNENTTSSKIALIFTSNEILNEATEGDKVGIILEETPFYAESGGQQGDSGQLIGQFGHMDVQTTKKLPDGTIYHLGVVNEGVLKAGEEVRTEYNTLLRRKTARNHTATHLLHATLKKVLGNHVNQAGSYVGADRLRFDFSHFSGISPEELEKVEGIVNDIIARELPVQSDYMNIDEAKSAGAMALFGEKYGDVVRVLSIGDESKELCGGTHIGNTSEILLFKIISEGSVGSGLRRIEAVTGDEAYKWTLAKQKTLAELSKVMKTKEDELPNRIGQFLEEFRDVEQRLKKMKENLLGEKFRGLLIKARDERIGNIDLIVSLVEDVESMEELRQIGDQIRKESQSFVAILAAIPSPDKVVIFGLASDHAVESGANVGELVKIIAQETGGNGGGKANTAQAGGKDVQKLKSGFEKALEQLRKQLKLDIRNSKL